MHHLHFEIGGKLFHEWMVQYFADAGFTDLEFNLRLRSLLMACIGIFFAVLYYYELTKKLFWGILGAIFIAFSHGYLHYATKVDTGIFPAAAFFPIAWTLVKMENVKRGIVILSFFGGIFLFISVMAHQYMAIGCVAACISIILPPFLFPEGSFLKPFEIKEKKEKPQIDARPTARYSAALLMAITGVILVCAGYFWCGKTQYNLGFDRPTPEVSKGIWRYATFQQWVFGYASEDMWGHGISEFDPARPVNGYIDSFLSKSVVLYKYDIFTLLQFNLDEPFDKKAFSFNQMIYFSIFVFLGTILLLPVLWRRYKRHMLFLILSVVGFFLFFTYWEPHYFEFWLIPAILVTSLSVCLLNVIGEKITTVFKRIGHLIPVAYFIFILFIVVNHNMLYHQIPHSRIRYKQGIFNEWITGRYKKLYDFDYYKYPDNVYKTIYNTKPGEYMPSK
jgi:hypothetical protein